MPCRLVRSARTCYERFATTSAKLPGTRSEGDSGTETDIAAMSASPLGSTWVGALARCANVLW